MKTTTKNVAKILSTVPSDQAILLRGAHGIGKSQLVAAAAKQLQIKCIDLRLSQMTEGDFLGLPMIDSMKKSRRTIFCPPWWFVEAQREKVMLFLDELNRASPEVMQCTFQLVLDRAIQGANLHPETRVVVAVNDGAMYKVHEIDPALLDRFLVIDVVPTLSDWTEWALNAKIDESIVDFCKQHPQHWWVDPAEDVQEPGKVYPTPRAWAMLDKCLAPLRDECGEIRHDDMTIAQSIIIGLVGIEAGIAYFDFVKNFKRLIRVENILDPKAYNNALKRKIKALSNERIMDLIEQIVNNAKKQKWTKTQMGALNQFFDIVDNNELLFALWAKLNNEPTGNKQFLDEEELRRENALTFHRAFRKKLQKALIG